jgi:hypothetical protein
MTAIAGRQTLHNIAGTCSCLTGDEQYISKTWTVPGIAESLDGPGTPVSPRRMAVPLISFRSARHVSSSSVSSSPIEGTLPSR